MASLNDIQITFEFEPIVKVLCTTTNCRFNLMNIKTSGEEMAACDLKHILIGYNATCRMYEPIKDETGKEE